MTTAVKFTTFKICRNSVTVGQCLLNALSACNGDATLSTAVTELNNVFIAMCGKFTILRSFVSFLTVLTYRQSVIHFSFIISFPCIQRFQPMWLLPLSRSQPHHPRSHPRPKHVLSCRFLSTLWPCLSSCIWIWIWICLIVTEHACSITMLFKIIHRYARITGPRRSRALTLGLRNSSFFYNNYIECRLKNIKIIKHKIYMYKAKYKYYQWKQFKWEACTIQWLSKILIEIYLTEKKTKVKIYKNMIKPDFKMHTIYIICTYLNIIIARYWNESLFIIK